MALYVTVTAGYAVAGRLEITRVSGPATATGGEDVSGPETGNVPATQQRPAGAETGTGPEARPDPGMVSTYAVTRDGARLGTVTHRYGDGAWALVRTALDLPVP